MDTPHAIHVIGLRAARDVANGGPDRFWQVAYRDADHKTEASEGIYRSAEDAWRACLAEVTQDNRFHDRLAWAFVGLTEEARAFDGFGHWIIRSLKVKS